MAPGCACGGTDGGLGPAGRRTAQDGVVRLPQARSLDAARRVQGPAAVACGPRSDLDRVRRCARAHSDRHEEARRLLVHLAHGLRHAGHLGGYRCRLHGSADTDVLSRAHRRAAVPAGGHGLRACAYPRDIRLRGHREGGSDPRRDHRVRCLRVPRPPGAEWVHRRVHGHSRRALAVRGVRGDRCLRSDPHRRIPAVDGEAGRVRPAQRGTRRHARHDVE